MTTKTTNRKSGTMRAHDFDNLVQVMRDAATAAIDADPGEGNDGGTCNLDTPAFRIHRAQKQDIELAAERAGVTVSEFKWWGGERWWWLNVPLYGQGNRRSAMMTAAQRVLNGVGPDCVKGWHACGYYAMD